MVLLNKSPNRLDKPFWHYLTQELLPCPMNPRKPGEQSLFITHTRQIINRILEKYKISGVPVNIFKAAIEFYYHGWYH
jgi:hypothetical protein